MHISGCRQCFSVIFYLFLSVDRSLWLHTLMQFCCHGMTEFFECWLVYMLSLINDWSCSISSLLLLIVSGWHFSFYWDGCSFVISLMQELNIGGSLVTGALEEVCGTSKSKIREMYNSFGDLGKSCLIHVFISYH